jgi:hypothetical protein
MHMLSRTFRVQVFRTRHGLAFRTTRMATTQPLLSWLGTFRYSRRTATWRSGYAAVCKTVYPGSIPGVASKTLRIGTKLASTKSQLSRPPSLARPFRPWL